MLCGDQPSLYKGIASQTEFSTNPWDVSISHIALPAILLFASVVTRAKRSQNGLTPSSYPKIFGLLDANRSGGVSGTAIATYPVSFAGWECLLIDICLPAFTTATIA